MGQNFGIKISKDGHPVRNGVFKYNQAPYWAPEEEEWYYYPTRSDDLIFSSNDFLLKVKSIISGYVDIPFSQYGYGMSNSLVISTGEADVVNIKAFWSLDNTNWYPIDDRGPASPNPILGVAAYSRPGELEFFAMDWTQANSPASRVYIRAIIFYDRI
jgi:hypothetical protein